MVDPYVLGVMRLADRRGLLTGLRTSAVQDWCLRMLMIVERDEAEFQRRQDRVDSLRQALVLSNPNDEEWLPLIQRVYPEIFPPEPVSEEVVTTVITEADFENSEGTWRFDQADTEPEDIEEVLRQLGQTMTVTADEAGIDTTDDGGWI